MTEDPHEQHNRLAPDILRRILAPMRDAEDTGGIGTTMVLLESIIVGVLAFTSNYNGNGSLKYQRAMLATLMANVAHRLIELPERKRRDGD